MSSASEPENPKPVLLLDVVWLKRDVRLHDHGPLSAAIQSKNAVVLLYLYEPDQLSEPTVHGSHLNFIQEGLIDLDQQLAAIETTEKEEDKETPRNSDNGFQCLTVCHATMIDCLEALHKGKSNPRYRIGRLLAHQETGHWKSFMRDKQVRAWCRRNGVYFDESFNQHGVKRCLKSRDDFSKKFSHFMSQPQYPSARSSASALSDFKSRLVVPLHLPGYMALRRQNEEFLNRFIVEIPNDEQRRDRPKREQKGGERRALATLESFLFKRGACFSQNISSPNTSWTSCSRLSAYLSWGHISLRHVVHALRHRQEELRQQKTQGEDIGPWLKSLQAFSSRLHWRSHFMQKLESEPELEKRDLCPAYQHLRRQEGDWNENRFQAWSSGKTGFPFVDACMRCLLQHGWINFRMRAMLISFATYNCWLDWSNKKLSAHMARVFLDYEPGIHYPQLQMQAGTTGINAMRVYSVTKQGKDQDPDGVFIRRHVPELERVPSEFVHQPWKMSLAAQQKCKVRIGKCSKDSTCDDWEIYPAPIVDEQESARVAKAKIAELRKQESTKIMAQAVYQKHGSRNGRRDAVPRAKNADKVTTTQRPQPKITRHFAKAAQEQPIVHVDKKGNEREKTKGSTTNLQTRTVLPAVRDDGNYPKGPGRTSHHGVRERPDKRKNFFQPVTRTETRLKKARVECLDREGCWSCKACTFLNENPLGLACTICGTER